MALFVLIGTFRLSFRGITRVCFEAATRNHFTSTEIDPSRSGDHITARSLLLYVKLLANNWHQDRWDGLLKQIRSMSQNMGVTTATFPINAPFVITRGKILAGKCNINTNIQGLWQPSSCRRLGPRVTESLHPLTSRRDAPLV